MFQRQVVGGRQGLQVSAALGTKQLKKAAPKKKNIPLPPGAGKRGLAKGQQPEDALWLPNTERPAWLTGIFLCHRTSILLVVQYTLAHVPDILVHHPKLMNGSWQRVLSQPKLIRTPQNTSILSGPDKYLFSDPKLSKIMHRACCWGHDLRALLFLTWQKFDICLQC